MSSIMERAKATSVIWSDHAKERAESRFPPHEQPEVPRFLIQIVAAQKAIGDDFRIRAGMAVFIVAKVEDDKVLIKTVFQPGKPEKMKDKRRKRPR